MAVDLKAIKAELNQLKNPKRGRRRNAFFSPRETDTTYRVRVVAFPDNDGKPFRSIKVYKNIKGWRGLTAPFQFNEDDPVQDVIDVLQEKRSEASGTEAEEYNNILKKLYPRDQYFALVLDRENPDDGLKLWRISQTIVQQLYSFILDEDYGDITDVENGFDIKVKKIEQNGKNTIQVTPAPRPSPLLEDADSDDVEELIENAPEWQKLLGPPSFDELKDLVTAFVNNGGVYDPNAESGRFSGKDALASKGDSSSSDSSGDSSDSSSDSDDSDDSSGDSEQASSVKDSVSKIEEAFSA